MPSSPAFDWASVVWGVHRTPPPPPSFDDESVVWGVLHVDRMPPPSFDDGSVVCRAMSGARQMAQGAFVFVWLWDRWMGMWEG